MMLAKLSKILSNPDEPLIHRDLSWLQFNERVLNEANDKKNPLLERLKFLGITASNLDEFFMIRYSSLEQEIQSNPENKQTKRIQKEVLEVAALFSMRQAQTLDSLIRGLSKNGIQIDRTIQSGTSSDKIAKEIFTTEILPHLSQPELYLEDQIKSLQNLNVAFLFEDRLFIQIPSNLPLIFWKQRSKKKISAFFLDDLLLKYLGTSLGIDKQPAIFRVTRDADVKVNLEDTGSVPDSVLSKIKDRERGQPMRVQYGTESPEKTIRNIQKVLGLSKAQMIPVNHSLFLGGLFKFASQVTKKSRFAKTLAYPRLRSRVPLLLRDTKTLYKTLRQRDYLLHHPYDSFGAYENFIEAAVLDSKVISIAQTVYRVDALSKVTDLLKQAARKKKVEIVIEPRARFDELNNVKLAEELRAAGVEVHFAYSSLKLHAKVALVLRNEKEGVRAYTHLSTGNYNATTARQYTDLAIMTADKNIGEDAKVFFEAIKSGKAPKEMKVLTLAPIDLHRRLKSLIQEEIKNKKQGKDARIFVKTNALVDPKIIQDLYRASQAGVKVDLNVRGACSLIPGLPSMSENIRVISIVDRFLEHSRIYYFESSKSLFLSSADWMPRNFFSRLEIAFPVLDKRIFAYIKEVVIPTYWNDHVKARELEANGEWRKRKPSKKLKGHRAQFIFEKLANRNYKKTPLET